LIGGFGACTRLRYIVDLAAVVLGGTTILGGQGNYLATIAGAVLLVTMTARSRS
jgi:ribose/xylose/arabinose/galactoside ABC-type transport system permease subunit